MDRCKTVELKIICQCFLVTLPVFIFDLLVPLGVAAGVPYVISVLFSLKSRIRYAAYFAATFTSFLVFLGWQLSPSGGVEWKVFTNRVLALLVIWCVATLCSQLKKKTEAQAKQAMNLAKVAQKSAQAKSDFLANMSHEIRTPMTAIIGFAETMLDPDQKESERINCVNIIRRNGDYLMEIIDDILDLSKIESGKATTERMTMKPCSVVKEVVSLMGVRADSKGIPLQVEFVGAIPETIHNDPTRLRQILINLIGNAIKFTEAGSIRLEVSFLESNDKPLLQFDVIDSGCGMSEKQIDKLFQPFTQADTSTTRRFGGTGLGLTISKRFAELLGGSLSVVFSEPGAGSVFRVTIETGSLENVKLIETSYTPLSECTTKKSEPKLSGNLKGIHVLLAEDGPDNQRLITFMLKKVGASVTVASNGQDAVEAVQSTHDEGRPFHAVLMDMQMPVLDGYKATGILRERGFTTLPIIALTAHAMSGDREKCLAAGCDDYTTKPIDRSRLVELISTYTSSQRNPSFSNESLQSET